MAIAEVVGKALRHLCTAAQDSQAGRLAVQAWPLARLRNLQTLQLTACACATAGGILGCSWQ